MGRYLREDLAAGLREGRFILGNDEITLDLHLGLIVMSLRRIVRGDAPAHHAERVVERALITLGIAKKEARKLATDVVSAET